MGKWILYKLWTELFKSNFKNLQAEFVETKD